MTYRRWTEQELEFVHDHVGILTFEEIGRRIGRTRIAIDLLRRTRYPFIPRVFDNIITIGTLSRELGKSRGAIAKWRQKGLITGKSVSRKAGYNKCPVVFEENEIIRFLKQNYDRFDYRNMPNRYFANVVREAQGD